MAQCLVAPLSAAELVNGVSRLKGPARTVAVAAPPKLDDELLAHYIKKHNYCTK